RPWGDSLRVADRSAALPRGDICGDAAAGGFSGRSAAVTAECPSAARPGDDLPEVPGEGSAAALRQRGGSSGRCSSVREERADRRAPGGTVGARAALDPAPSYWGSTSGNGAGSDRAGDWGRGMAHAATGRATGRAAQRSGHGRGSGAESPQTAP